MRITVLMVALVTFSVPVFALEKGDKINFGSRAGMEVTIVSVDGLDSETAVIRTEFTPDDAKRFCVEYIGKVTRECIAQQLELNLNDRITANCRTGEFVDFHGDHHRFEGKNDDQSAGFADYIIRDLATGEVADGSNASGYPVNFEIFRALCPSGVPNG